MNRSPARRRRAATKALRGFCFLIACLATIPASAGAATQTEIDAAVANAVAYTRSQQDPSTGALVGFGGDWAVASLAAAGIDAAEVHGPLAGAPSLQDFQLSEYSAPGWTAAPSDPVTEYERAILVAHAAGLDPARISADSNLPAQIAGLWNPATGSFGTASTNGTAFAVLALATTPMPSWALAPAVSFLRQNRHDDGGWNYGPATTPAQKAATSDPDMTGAVIGAFCEAGLPAYDADVASGLGFLNARLVEGTGAIHSDFGDNADTTAWAVSGLNACGIDPQSAEWTTAAGKTPIDHLLSLQVPSGAEAGGFGYSDNSGAVLYSTQDALRAIAGGAFTATPASLRSTPSVATGTPVPHTLVIGRGSGDVRICKVTAPAGASLTQLLGAAQAESLPSGCVSGFSVEGGRVTAINGVAPESIDRAWLLRLDRGAEVAAADQPVGFGDLVALRIGDNPAADQGPAGTPGAAGAPGLHGESGPRGKRGPRGKPGRNAEISCRVHQRAGGKKKTRCSVKYDKRAKKGSVR